MEAVSERIFESTEKKLRGGAQPIFRFCPENDHAYVQLVVRKQEVSPEMPQRMQQLLRLLGGFNHADIFGQPGELPLQILQVGRLGKIVVCTRLIPLLDVL